LSGSPVSALAKKILQHQASDEDAGQTLLANKLRHVQARHYGPKIFSLWEMLQMKMGAGFSLAGLVVALVGAFVPIIGLMLGGVALALATVGALAGEPGLTIAVIA
jgi:hypothetical protein